MNKTNRAFIFDMDGVLVDSEQIWHKHAEPFYKSIFGEEIHTKMGNLTGISLDQEYELATSYGLDISKDEFFRRYDEQAIHMYAKSSITKDVDILLKTLKSKEFKLGIVSASPSLWIDQVLPKISSRDLFDYVLSLDERKDLRHKPHPDGFIEMMNILEASPSQTVILEDSNRGISSAKASGAFTIAYTENLIPGYEQISADAKAATMQEVIEITRKHFEI